MPQVKGTEVRVLGLTESVYKTPPGTPDAEVLYVQSFGPAGSEERVTDSTLSGTRGNVRSVADSRDVAGPVPVSLAPESIGYWLKHLIGTPVTSGAGPYTHTFAVANGLPAGMMFEVDYGASIAGAGRFIRYNGCRLAQGAFTLPARGLPTASFDVRGAAFDATATGTIDATPTDPGHTAFSAKHLSLSFDGGALAVSAEQAQLTISNDLDDSVFAVGGQGERSALTEGFAIVSGSVTAFFDSPALMNKALADTDAALIITLSRGDGLGTAGNESLVITIPNLVFAVAVPPVEGPRGLKLTANFTAHKTTGEIGVTAVLKNARPTIT